MLTKDRSSDMLQRLICVLVLIYGLAGVSHAYIDGFNPNANGPVTAVVVLADGNLLVGGDFTNVGGVACGRIARLRVDGTVDTSFTAVVNGTVLAIAEQTNGKILIGGRFTTVNGASHNYIARLNDNGSLDSTFLGSGASDFVNAIAVQTDGKILVGGRFTTINGGSRNRIARLNANGTVDGTFNPGTGADMAINAIAIQADGKAVIGGDFTTVNGTARNRIARLSANGSLDTTFGPGSGFNAGVNALAIQPDGQLLACGSFTVCRAMPAGRIARMKPDGSHDKTFTTGTGSGANDTIHSMVIQPDGQILIAGAFTAINGITAGRIARLGVDGTFDSSFDPGTGADNTVSALAIQADGKSIVAAGDFTSITGNTRNHLARFDPAGVLDTNFFKSNTLTFSCMAVQPDGKVIVGGLGVFGRFNSDGTYDTSFLPGEGVGTGGRRSVLDVAVQPDGKIVIGGNFASYNGVARNNIARVNSDGSLDTAFNSGTGPEYPSWALLLQPDGKVYLSGVFLRFNGMIRIRLARLNPDGSLDLDYEPEASGTMVGTLALQTDGKLLGGGTDLFRLNRDGSRDTSFTVQINGDALAVAVQPDGKILVGCDPYCFNNTSCTVRLNPDGSIDPSFNAGAGNWNYVQTLVVEADNKILAGRVFDGALFHVVRLNPDGSLDSQYVFDGDTRQGSHFVIQEDGKIILDSTTRFATTIPSRQKLSVTPGGYSVTWALGGNYPWPYAVVFEDSNDGVNWHTLGTGNPVPGVGYRLSNLRMPVKVNHYLRATGFVSASGKNGSVSLFRSVLRYYDDSPPYSATANWALFR